ncbi:hypothetical protein CAMGR0001_0894 [Campylobacter gracilis RM3268]|uniref:Uncharacterized protein n=1 Tax=Campylobacter gracilis RM3268 TaxID=553220 RepID=C8PGA1_9BACT|nr:hypothetical protein CAMGR0001_0894 [Campylobacter gracilis RM3268]
MIKISKFHTRRVNLNKFYLHALRSRVAQIRYSIENRAAQLAKVVPQLRLNLKAHKFSTTRCF